ncbi:MAG: glycosyltransferase family 1 protein [Planctomycetaceae bacterium]|nr:glycosyltransferase family 1 protein [Planctomycetaceae bacterium]
MPIRVLHVIGGTECGGSESWLVELAKRCDRRQLSMDFLVHSHEPGHYDQVLIDHGAKLLRCASPRSPWRYARTFRRLLRQYGPYQVVHSHVSFFSGLPLKVAAHAAVPMRVAHSHHVTATDSETHKSVPRGMYESIMGRWIARHATHRISTSDAAQRTLDSRQNKGESWQTIYCGIDLTPFQRSTDSIAIRNELGIPESAFVVGHTGRFVEVKNHGYLLDTMAHLLQQDPTYMLVLMGDGELRPQMEAKASELGIAQQVRFLGVRTDVAKLLSGAIDTFAFPSHHEGLGLALIEAQAAGLPCITSSSVPEEATVVPELITRLPLSAGPAVWAEAIATIRKQPLTIDRQTAYQQVAASHFNIATNLRQIKELYAKVRFHKSFQENGFDPSMELSTT